MVLSYNHLSVLSLSCIIQPQEKGGTVKMQSSRLYRYTYDRQPTLEQGPGNLPHLTAFKPSFYPQLKKLHGAAV